MPRGKLVDQSQKDHLLIFLRRIRKRCVQDSVTQGFKLRLLVVPQGYLRRLHGHCHECIVLYQLFRRNFSYSGLHFFHHGSELLQPCFFSPLDWRTKKILKHNLERTACSWDHRYNGTPDFAGNVAGALFGG
ncbi:MAG: hypothetical protein RJA34_840 [Pseudomonadota bacterium]